MLPNYYEVLGLANTATQEEVKQAFRNLQREHHPDKFERLKQAAMERGADEVEIGVFEEKIKSANEKIQLVNEAYEVLRDVAKRSAYDRSQSEANSPPDVKSAPVEDPYILIKPLVLDFGIVEKGETVTRQLHIVNAGGRPINEPSPLDWSGSWLVDNGITYDPTSFFPIKGEFKVKTNELGQGKYQDTIQLIVDGKIYSILVKVEVKVKVASVLKPKPSAAAPVKVVSRKVLPDYDESGRAKYTVGHSVRLAFWIVVIPFASIQGLISSGFIHLNPISQSDLRYFQLAMIICSSILWVLIINEGYAKPREGWGILKGIVIIIGAFFLGGMLAQFSYQFEFLRQYLYFDGVGVVFISILLLVSTILILLRGE